MGYLFPGVLTPVRNTGTPSSFDKGEECGANIRREINPPLNKRGMTFSHVNIVTLQGHFADANVLLKKTASDVFAVTESCLDRTILDGPVCPSGHVCYGKDRGGCAFFW